MGNTKARTTNRLMLCLYKSSLVEAWHANACPYGKLLKLSRMANGAVSYQLTNVDGGGGYRGGTEYSVHT